MKDNLVLTFDIGTQSLRAMIVSDKGEIIDYSQMVYETPYKSIKPDYAENKPSFYFDYLVKASNDLKNKCEHFKDVKAVTITCIRDTVLCLDKENKPLRDIILWLDKREANRSKLPKIPLYKKLLFSLVGVKDTIKMQQSQSICNYLMTEEKDMWDKCNKYVMLPTYINYLLTGNLKDTSANQIGHVPFDYKHNCWMRKGSLTRFLFDVDLDKLCDLVYPGDIIGYITSEASKATGIKEGLPLIATGSDKACETLGLSAISLNKAAISFGTTATIQFTTKKYFEPLPFAPSYPAAIKDYFNAEIQTYRGYWMLSWYKREFASKEIDEAKKLNISPEELLNKHLNEIKPGSDGLILQPYWSPGVSNPNARGATIGFRDCHTKYHIYKAIIEGINFSLMDGLYSMQKRGKQKIDELYVGGGGSKSDEICQLTADMFNLPVKRIQTHEACGLGSSMIAFVSLNVYKDINEAVEKMVRVKDTFIPNKEVHEKYMNIYKNVYSKMYKKLEPLYLNLKRIGE